MAVLPVAYGPAPTAAGADWVSARRSTAASMLGVSENLLIWYGSDVGMATADIVGVKSASATALSFPATPRGGTVLMQTSTTASQFNGISCAIGTSNGVVGVIKNERWAFAARAKFSAGSAQSNHELGVTSGVGGIGVITGNNNGVGIILVNGAASLQINGGGALTTVASTWTVDTTLFHDVMVTFDLTTVRLFVDGAQVASTTTLTNMPNTAASAHATALVANGTDVVNYTLQVDKLGCFVPEPS